MFDQGRFYSQSRFSGRMPANPQARASDVDDSRHREGCFFKRRMSRRSFVN